MSARNWIYKLLNKASSKVMGTSRRHKQKFFNEHPTCAFCGGGTPATTIEHCPPRALFQHRQWPEGFEFPACEKCNNGSSDDDLLFAVLGRMNPFGDKANLDGRLENLIKNVNGQFPGMISKMFPSPNEARRMNRRIGVSPAKGQTYQEAGVVKITAEMRKAVEVVAAKLSKAIFYLETKSIFPNHGCLLFSWFTNADLVRDGKYVAFEVLKDIAGTSISIIRTGNYLEDQFSYKLSLTVEGDTFALQVAFGMAFAFVVFGCTEVGRLEAHIEGMRANFSGPGPFKVLKPGGL